MKVGVNARTFTVDEPDGAVQTAREFTRRLGTRKDIELLLFGDERLKAQFDAADTVRSTGFLSNSPFWGIVWERSVLPYLVRQEDVDVLLCPNGNAPMTSVGCPIVTYIHDVNAQKGMSSGVHKLYRKSAVPLGVRNSDAIVTVSEFSKGEIVEHLPVAPEKVTVIYNGVDDFYLEEGGSEPMDLPEEYILYVGAMNPRKNVERLVEVYDEVRADIPHELVLIGPQNKSVYKDMDVKEFADDIVTPGFVPKAQLKYAYENADAFVYLSLYEGFGLPPLEAMACGTPVVAAARTSLPEILNDQCEMVDPTDRRAVEAAIMDTVSSPKATESARELKRHAGRFTWEKSVRRLHQLLEDVSRPRSAPVS